MNAEGEGRKETKIRTRTRAKPDREGGRLKKARLLLEMGGNGGRKKKTMERGRMSPKRRTRKS